MMDTEHIKRITEAALSYTPKEKQLETVNSYFLDKRDTILIAPTGFGKSYVYQIAPFLHDSKYRDRFLTEESYHMNVTTIVDGDSESALIDSTAQLDSVNQYQVMGLPPEADTTAGAVASSTPVRPSRGATSQVQESAVDELTSLFQETSIGLDQTKTQDVIQFLVIMPLVAMITDGLVNLKRLMPQVSAVHFTAATMKEAKVATMVFASPETLLSQCGCKFLQEAANIKAVFVDEFHIVSAWGLSESDATAFRECYGRLGELKAYLKGVPFVCMSATAPESVIASVSKSLRLVTPNLVKVQINKQNICYHIIRVKGSVTADFRWLVTLLMTTALENVPRILIFFRNVNTLADAFAYVTVNSGQAPGNPNSCLAMFHLNTLADIKRQVLADLSRKDGKLKVVFCTSSLSMGMNLAMIEYVLHYAPPLSSDAFFQETGRAGRETDLMCHSILLTYPRMFSGCKPDDTMAKYAKSEDGCLREIILSRFNTTKPSDQPRCCMRCHHDTPCNILSFIEQSFDSSLTESMSSTDSVASLESIESIPDM